MRAGAFLAAFLCGVGFAPLADAGRCTDAPCAGIATQREADVDLLTGAIARAVGYPLAALHLRRSCFGFPWGADAAELAREGAGHYEHEGGRRFGKPSHEFAGRDFRLELIGARGLSRVRLTLKQVTDSDFGALHRLFVDQYGTPASDAPLDEGLWVGRATEWRFGDVGLSLQVATHKGGSAEAATARDTVLTIACEKRTPLPLPARKDDGPVR